jgi:hypothetical protein
MIFSSPPLTYRAEGKTILVHEHWCNLSEDFLHLLLSAFDETWSVYADEEEAALHTCRLGGVGSAFVRPVRKAVISTQSRETHTASKTLPPSCVIS